MGSPGVEPPGFVSCDGYGGVMFPRPPLGIASPPEFVSCPQAAAPPEAGRSPPQGPSAVLHLFLSCTDGASAFCRYVDPTADARHEIPRPIPSIALVRRPLFTCSSFLPTPQNEVRSWIFFGRFLFCTSLSEQYGRRGFSAEVCELVIAPRLAGRPIRVDALLVIRSIARGRAHQTPRAVDSC